MRDALARQQLEKRMRGWLLITNAQNEELKGLNTSLESKGLERTAELRKL